MLDLALCTYPRSGIYTFDPDNDTHDIFRGLGPIFFYNAAAVIGAVRTYILYPESMGYGFTLGGNRPVVVHDVGTWDMSLNALLPAFIFVCVRARVSWIETVFLWESLCDIRADAH